MGSQELFIPLCCFKVLQYYKFAHCLADVCCWLPVVIISVVDIHAFAACFS